MPGHTQRPGIDYILTGMKDNSEELFPIVDEAGNAIGAATRGMCHSGSKLLHPVVHLHVFDSLGRLYLQRRPRWKDIQPGKWDTAVGGHVDLGENTLAALHREAAEELGLRDFEPELIGSYIFESDREREFVTAYRTTVSPEAVHPSDELDGGRFWPIDEIIAALPGDTLTPNFATEFRRLLHPHA